ncbi:MAG: hypothetical protein DRP65_02435 [Planctomycetota bacterium]|nr:MAG: hypothetical protein DRP65_02435 [Planctomycetota bacterium]
MTDRAFVPPFFLCMPGTSLSPGCFSDHKWRHLLWADVAHITPDTTAAARIPLEVVFFYLPAVLVLGSFYEPV